MLLLSKALILLLTLILPLEFPFTIATNFTIFSFIWYPIYSWHFKINIILGPSEKISSHLILKKKITNTGKLWIFPLQSLNSLGITFSCRIAFSLILSTEWCSQANMDFRQTWLLRCFLKKHSTWNTDKRNAYRCRKLFHVVSFNT